VTVSVRPECWTISAERPAQNAVRGRIGGSIYLGEDAQYEFLSGGISLKVLELNPRFVDRPAAEQLYAGARADDVVVLKA
jgi:iron(III) transport system ATP-binding protein